MNEIEELEEAQKQIRHFIRERSGDPKQEPLLTWLRLTLHTLAWIKTGFQMSDITKDRK